MGDTRVFGTQTYKYGKALLALGDAPALLSAAPAGRRAAGRRPGRSGGGSFWLTFVR